MCVDLRRGHESMKRYTHGVMRDATWTMVETRVLLSKILSNEEGIAERLLPNKI